MRSRTIKPSFFSNEQLADCAPLARILFAGLWCMSDRAGKLRDRPRKIKAEVLPFEATADADALLCELATVGLIVRYEVGGERYIKIPGFEKHQNPHPKEAASEIPEPDLSAARPDLSADSREKDGTSPAVSCFLDPVSKREASVEERPSTPSLFAENDPRVAPVESPEAEPAQGVGGRINGEVQASPTPPARVKPPTPATTRHASLTSLLVADFERVRGSKYLHQGAKDAAALKRLLAVTEDDAEIRRRWTAALRADGFHRCDTLAQLAQHWNHFAQQGGATVKRLRPLGPPESANA